ncbi:MAG: hypothetical protein CL608_24000 [Anaerolineaceae bacterium]|nr:hypothetical protein [Anaerolineaceae bacterium]
MRVPDRLSISQSGWVFAGLVTALVLLRLILLFLPEQAILASQESLLSWTAVAIVIVLGFAGRYLARRTGFPRMWDTAVTTTGRLLLPVIIGLGLGLIWIWLAAALVALIEPLGLVGPILQAGSGFTVNLSLLFGFSYLANLIFADLFRRYGFMAPVTARLTFYLVWHIIFAGLL